MKRFLAFVWAFLFATTAAVAQYSPPGGGPYQGSTVAPSTSGNVMTSNGSAWTSAAASGGGGSSPFAPAGFANVSTFSSWLDLAVSPDGAYVYVAGNLASNNHGAIAQVKTSDGTVKATVDLGATFQPEGLAVSSDSAALYAFDKAAGTTWWKITTSTMAVAHTSTLAVAVAHTTAQQFDLSPDGSIYAYVSAADAKLYMIDTSTYAVTNQIMNNTAGNLTAVCFYNGSNSNVYVAHAGSGVVDLYAIGGAYTSSVSTGAGGTPAFKAMRSGINGNFWIVDLGSSSLIRVHSGTADIVQLNQAGFLAVNTGTIVGASGGIDVCAVRVSPPGGGGGFFLSTGLGPSYSQYDGLIVMPTSLEYDNVTGACWFPDDSGRIATLTGENYPEAWSVPTLLLQPFTSNPGFTGSNTIAGGGTVTVTCAPCTTGSIIDVSPTGTANVLPPAVTTKSAGSFVVTGTATGTFDWVLLKP